MTEPFVPDDLAASLTEKYHLGHETDMAGMTPREEEEFLARYGPKEIRDAIKKRRKEGGEPEKRA